MTTEVDPIVGIPVIEGAVTGTAVEEPLVRPRWEGGVLALIGALAGFASGWIGVSGTLGPLAALLMLVAVIAVIAAFGLAWPAIEPLRASGMDELRRELDRARRHRRSFALVRLAAGPADGVPRESARSGDAMARLVGASLRITDRAWRDGHGVMIMQPETDRASAEAFAERLRSMAPDRLAAPISIAIFPDDGLTSGALLDALDRADRGEARPEPLTRATIEASAIAVGDPSDPSTDILRTEAG